MATVHLEGFGEVTVRVGTSILDAAIMGQLPVGGACGGVCACSTCHVYVKEGAELLSAQDGKEADVLDKAFDVRASSRLGCQARVIGDGTITVEIALESLEAYENEHPSQRGKYTSRPGRRSADQASDRPNGATDSAE
jgi:2Fe-2S ferredoxin